MNAAHVHLMVNHVSLFCLLIGLVALAFSIRRKTPDLRVLASSLLVAAGVFAWVAFFTGEGAEDLLETLGGNSKAWIEQHEQAANWARGSATLVALLAIAHEWSVRRKKKFAKVLQWALVAFGLHGCTVYMATSFLGGKISHPELRDSK